MRDQSNSHDITKKYKKLNQIHKGKNSEVYRYKNRKTGTIVAVKKIDKKNLDQQNMQFVRQELQIMKCLHHHTFAELLEINETERYIYIVMEYIDGLDLSKF